MKLEELKVGMIIDCVHSSSASADILVIKSIHNEMIFCERFYSDEFLKGCNWQPFIIHFDTWNNTEDYLWWKFEQITGREAMVDFFGSLKNE